MACQASRPLQIQDDVNRAPFLSPQMCFSGGAIFLPWTTAIGMQEDSIIGKPCLRTPSNATCKWCSSYQEDSQQGTTTSGWTHVCLSSSEMFHFKLPGLFGSLLVWHNSHLRLLLPNI
ncbi:hypothetical protein TNCV_3057701 [Trichonephila clavipes]|nr:hypothetical protein TNCV_3057701 [Trichonephila clavipes]